MTTKWKKELDLGCISKAELIEIGATLDSGYEGKRKVTYGY